MSLDPTTLWLLGDGPEPGEEAVAAFTDADVPPELAERTLAAARALFDEADASPMRSQLQLHRGGRVRRLIAGGGVVAALAAAVLLTLPAPQHQGDLDRMTQRGLGGDMPALDLRMAVRTASGVDRLRADRTYGAGDVFYFRYQAAADGWLHLIHATDGGIEVLESQPVTRGHADLTRGGEPLAWTVDDSDPDQAVFALVRTAVSVPASELSLALTGALASDAPVEPSTLCRAATALELSCDAQAVRVQR
jgi:hypothetical protein